MKRRSPALIPRRRVLSGLAALALCALCLPFAAAPPALAEDDPLVIGVFPRRAAEATTRMFSPLTDYLSARLGRPVRLETAKDFDTFWEGVTARRFDLVHFNQFHYLQAHDRHGYDVIVNNEEFGSGSLTGAIYVRKDSGITTLSQLKGKKIAFGGGPDAMMSYIIPRYLLQQAGLAQGDYTEAFSVNPPNAVFTAFFGQADAAGAGDVVIDLPIVRQRIKADEMLILARSQPVRHLPWAVRADLPEALKDRLRGLMLALNDDEAGRAILKSAGLTGLSPGHRRRLSGAPRHRQRRFRHLELTERGRHGRNSKNRGRHEHKPPAIGT